MLSLSDDKIRFYFKKKIKNKFLNLNRDRSIIVKALFKAIYLAYFFIEDFNSLVCSFCLFNIFNEASLFLSYMSSGFVLF